uniref:Outer coat protein n=1 Tax=Drosophila melanogaster sigmavirus TaxID=1094373 RepID=G9BQA6_9RHAB|nr:outer coat protein [Drosophila melanogaster sigmavirus]
MVQYETHILFIHLWMLALIFITTSVWLAASQKAFTPDLVFPEMNRNSSWSVANYGEILCPTSFQSYDPKKHQILTRVLVERPSLNTDTKVEGYTCHKVKYETICDMPWYFSPAISHSISPLRVRESECKDAIAEHQLGTHVSLSFPPEDCSWNSVNTKAYEDIIVKDHPVMLDPYTNNYVDAIFPGGISSPGMGGTIHDDMMWVSKDLAVSPECSGWQQSMGLIYSSRLYGEREPMLEVGSIHIEGHRDKNLTLACRISFCGEIGVRFHDGEWMKVSVNLDHPNSVTFQVTDFPPCPPGTTIQTAVVENINPEIQELTVNMMYRLKCQETISKMVSGLPTSALDLSYLIQVQEGPGIVYKREKGVLYQSVGMYQYIDTVTLNKEENQLGENAKGQKVFWTEWSDSPTRPDLQEGINGIVKYEGQIRVPLGMSLRLEAATELMWGHPVHTVSHPILHVISNHTDQSVTTWNRGVNSTNLIGLATRSISGFYNDLKLYLILALIVVSIVALVVLDVIPFKYILFILCPPLLLCRFIKCSRRKPETGDRYHVEYNRPGQVSSAF